MEAKLSSNVADLSDEQRRVLESLIGQPLLENQVLYWILMTVGGQPTAADKAQAPRACKNCSVKSIAMLLNWGSVRRKFEVAVDEAVRHARSRERAE